MKINIENDNKINQKRQIEDIGENNINDKREKSKKKNRNYLDNKIIIQ